MFVVAFMIFHGVPISGGCPQTFLPRLDIDPAHVIARFVSATNNGWKQMEQDLTYVQANFEMLPDSQSSLHSSIFHLAFSFPAPRELSNIRLSARHALISPLKSLCYFTFLVVLNPRACQSNANKYNIASVSNKVLFR